MSNKVFIYLPQDDERKTLGLVLFDAGLTPISTGDPANARELVEDGFYDLIICPFEEDKSNPFHFIEEVVRKKHPFTPIFLFAPKLKLDLITRAIRLGVRDIFNLPIDYVEILNSVHHHLKDRPGQKSSGEEPQRILARLVQRVNAVLPGQEGAEGSSAPADWELRLEDLKKEKAALEEKLKASGQSQAKIDSLEKKIADLVRERDELTNEFEAKLASTNQKWVDMERTLLEREKKLNEELATMNGKAKGETSEEAKKWMEKCMVLEEQNHKLRSSGEEMESEVTTLKERLKKASSADSSAIQEELDNLKASFAAREKELQAALEQKVALLETRDDDSSTSSAQLDLSGVEAPELDSIGNDLEKMKEAYQQIKAALTAREKESQRLLAQLEERENDLNEAKMLMNEREAYIEECENTMMEKSMELHEREVEFEQMKDEIFKEKARLAALAEGEGGEGSSSLEEIESMRASLEKEKQNLADQKAKFEAEQKKWREEREAELQRSKEGDSGSGGDGESGGEDGKPAGKSLEEWKRMQRRSKLLRSW